jgi:hypothetical protein
LFSHPKHCSYASILILRLTAFSKIDSQLSTPIPLGAMFRGGTPHHKTANMMRILIGHGNVGEDICTFVLNLHCKKPNLPVGCSSLLQEICYRAMLIRMWYAELDHCINERLITPTRYHMRNIEELQMELQKLDGFVYNLTMIDSM